MISQQRLERRREQTVYIDDPDEDFNEQLAASYRRAQDCTNTRVWFDDPHQVDHLDTKVAGFSPGFWFSFWTVVIAAILLVLWIQHHPHQGVPMSHPPETEKPAAPASAPGEPHGSTLHATIDRFARALIAAGTLPDTGMFFFDAQDLTVNGKLETLKMRALVDTLEAVLPHAIRARFEKRLEELVLLSAQQLEEGARRIALTARGGEVNGSGHG